MTEFSVNNDLPQAAKKIAAQLRERVNITPLVGLILGSGWGGIAAALDNRTVIPYADLQDMPACGVRGHAGNFVFGHAEKTPVVAVQGRFHMYEGHGAERAVLPVRILYELGVRIVILTNAAGGLNPHFSVGDLMILHDHINFTGRNPLVGVRPSAEFPEIFTDMTRVYDRELCETIHAVCGKMGIANHAGTYMQVLGPSYETPAEIRAYRLLGADAVGMSTAVEAIYARYLGIRVAGVSCITNLGAGLQAGGLAHADVLKESDRRGEVLTELMRDILRSLK